jgi:hypothetical protein
MPGRLSSKDLGQDLGQPELAGSRLGVTMLQLDKPDFRAITERRRRHLRLVRAVRRGVEAVSVGKSGKLRPAAVAGTRLAANASQLEAMSYERMRQAEPKLAAEVAAWLTAADASLRGVPEPAAS